MWRTHTTCLSQNSPCCWWGCHRRRAPAGLAACAAHPPPVLWRAACRQQAEQVGLHDRGKLKQWRGEESPYTCRVAADQCRAHPLVSPVYFALGPASYCLTLPQAAPKAVLKTEQRTASCAAHALCCAMSSGHVPAGVRLPAGLRQRTQPAQAGGQVRRPAGASSALAHCLHHLVGAQAREGQPLRQQLPEHLQGSSGAERRLVGGVHLCVCVILQLQATHPPGGR